MEQFSWRFAGLAKLAGLRDAATANEIKAREKLSLAASC
jgi:hypothetical protein